MSENVFICYTMTLVRETHFHNELLKTECTASCNGKHSENSLNIPKIMLEQNMCTNEIFKNRRCETYFGLSKLYEYNFSVVFE